MSERSSQHPRTSADWRVKGGMLVFVLSIVLPVVGIPLAATLGLPPGTLATVSGALLGGAEVLGLLAAAIMGRDGFAFLKDRLSRFLKQYGPPAEVNRTRYRLGIAMFTIPVLFGWLGPYLADYVHGYRDNQTEFAVAGDVVFLTSLLVLGGDFWDKLRALFLHAAKAVFPDASVS